MKIKLTEKGYDFLIQQNRLQISWLATQSFPESCQKLADWLIQSLEENTKELIKHKEKFNPHE